MFSYLKQSSVHLPSTLVGLDALKLESCHVLSLLAFRSLKESGVCLAILMVPISFGVTILYHVLMAEAILFDILLVLLILLLLVLERVMQYLTSHNLQTTSPLAQVPPSWIPPPLRVSERSPPEWSLILHNCRYPVG